MAWIIALCIALWPAGAEALRAWDPNDLTAETASANLAASRIAAELTQVDPAMLLFIAWHESRFHQDTVTPEPGHKFSCGVMTPVPRRACRQRTPLLQQYAEGGAHLRGWYAACGAPARDGADARAVSRCALLGYAGGYALIRACGRRGHMWRHRGPRSVDLCGTAELYASGAADIERALAGGKDEAR